jgi:hypothetical protein
VPPAQEQNQATASFVTGTIGGEEDAAPTGVASLSSSWWRSSPVRGPIGAAGRPGEAARPWTPDPCLQSPCTLSATVAGLSIGLPQVRVNRPLAGLVAVSRRGQAET